MPSASRDAGLLLADIEEACERVLRFTAGLSRNEVLSDAMRVDAVLHNLHLVGEAVKKLPKTHAPANPTYPGVRSPGCGMSSLMRTLRSTSN